MNKKILIILLFLLNITIVSAISVPLTVQERANINRVNEPVTSGIPFSESDNILTTNNLEILDNNNNPIPAQFKVLGRYNGLITDTSKPIKVVLVDFQTNINANGKKTFYLTDEGSGTWSNPYISTDYGTYIQTNTGKINVKIDKNANDLFSQVTLNGKSLIKSSNAIIGYNGNENYTLSHTDVVIEENGPLKSVVKTTGFFKKDSSYLIPPLGDYPVSYTIRYFFYYNSSEVKVQFRLENENKAWPGKIGDIVHNIYIDYLKLKIDFNMTSTTKKISEISTNNNLYLIQNHVENSQEESNNFEYKITDGTNTLETGSRYNGSMQLCDSQTCIGFAKRWFWENWPEGLNLKDNTMEIDLLPDLEYKHRILGGIYKTHEFIIDFNNTNIDKTQSTIKKALVARPTDVYFAETNFYMPLAPENISTNYTYPANETQQDAIKAQIRKYEAKIHPDVIDVPNYYTIPQIYEMRPYLFERDFVEEFNWTLSSHGTNEYYMDYKNGMIAPSMVKVNNLEINNNTLGALSGNEWGYGDNDNLGYDTIYIRLNDGSDPDNSEINPAINITFGYYGNFYGWLWWGDFTRGPTFGYSGPHYAWDYASLLGYIRLNDYDYWDFAQDILVHKADITIMHDKNGTTNSNRVYNEYLANGGNRYEDDALLSFKEDTLHFFSSAPKKASHSWDDGLFLMYFLTGEERYYKVAMQTVNHMEYAFIQFDKCDDPVLKAVTCASSNHRDQSRATKELINGYSVTGNLTYLNDAFNIFNVSLLSLERETNGTKKGWIVRKEYDKAHILYDTIAGETAFHLYYALNESGQYEKAEYIKDYIIRQVNWVKDDLFKSWETSECGVYNTNKTLYFPYLLSSADWNENTTWNSNPDATYSYMFSDEFAFVYLQTGDITYLNYARAMFKDFLFYGSFPQWLPINEVYRAQGYTSNAGTAWAKEGMHLTMPTFYLRTEWEYSKGNITEYHKADLDHSGKIETNELKSFLQRWKQHLESFVDMFDVVKEWKSG